MDFLYNYNALPFFTERDLLLRRHVIDYFSFEIRELIREQNRAFQFVQIEAPILMPSDLLRSNYTSEDVWFQENQHPVATAENTLVLKPETTASSYLYAEKLLKDNAASLPLCV
jgi:threonyl-tRNA synthetase